MAVDFSLDYETLWSGLSASKVFEWHDSHFWILFYADVARKLRDRVTEGTRASAAVAKGVKRKGRKVKTGRSLIALQWFLDLQHRREKRSWKVVVCGHEDVDVLRSLGNKLSSTEVPWLSYVQHEVLPKKESCFRSSLSREFHVVLQIGFACEKLIWELLAVHAPRILWLDSADLRRDLAGWLCFSWRDLLPLFQPFELQEKKDKAVLCWQEP